MDEEGKRLTELIEILAACFYLTLAVVLGSKLAVPLILSHDPGEGGTR
jgi:hypothetical protein